jgi:DNA (cytosine-5)-methyltransferase 1
MLKLLDLFSGIGGFSLGMEATKRIKTIAFVEKDKFCRKVLSKNFKNIPIEEDIRNVKGSNYTANIVSGGFPCQPFSVAGKQRGKDDDRYLWDETIRVVAETKPRWFVGENVEGLVNINNGLVLRQVQDDLEKEGFQVQCLIIPASGIGAWHQRKRVWIIAHSDSNRNSNEKSRSYGEKEKIQREYREENSSAWKSFGTNTNDKNVTNTECLGWYERSKKSEKFEGKKTSDKFNNCIEGQSIGKTYLSMDDVWHSESSRRKGSSDGQREGELWGTSTSTVQRQRTWWEVESELCGIPYGLSARLDKDRSNRIKALGNSIVPLIAYEIGKAIVNAEIQQD